MKKKFIYIPLLLLLPIIFITGCKGDNKDEIPDFPYVEIPLMVRQQPPQQIREYLLGHFWNRYISKAQEDTAVFHIENKKFEEAFANYVGLLWEEPDYNKVATSQKALMAKADSFAVAGCRKFFMDLVKYNELYLYNPNSPYLNEELYIPALEGILASESLDSLSKIPYSYQLDLALLNRVGQKANDFPYIYLSGGAKIPKESTLHETEGEYLLIYFNNPGCMSCTEIKSILEQNGNINSMIESGKLVILSLYIDGDDRQWLAGYDDFPQEWIYAKGDRSLFSDNSLYGIRAIPSLYLLDRDKKVLLKDASIGRAIDFLALLGDEQE